VEGDIESQLPLPCRRRAVTHTQYLLNKALFWILGFPSYKRLFWRARDDSPVETYRIKKVTSGTASAPYLAIKSMHPLISHWPHQL
jgi:hypothetical protein